MTIPQRHAMLLANLIWLALFVPAVVGLKQSAIIYQAWDLWRAGYNPLSALVAGEQHSLRYVVYWPMLAISANLGIDPDRLFTIVSAFVSLMLTWAIVRSDFLLSRRQSLWRSGVYSLIVVALSYLIEGRIIFLLAGYSALIWAALQSVTTGRWTLWQAIALLGGGLLCSLSSGTLAVAGAFVGLFGLWSIVSRHLEGRGITLIYSLLAFGIVFAGWMLWGLARVLAYYDNNPVAMLNHGLGRVILIIGPAGFVALGIVSLVGLIVLYWLYRNQSRPMFVLTLAILPAIAGGLFGFTTMAMGVVPLLLVARPNLWQDLIRHPDPSSAI